VPGQGEVLVRVEASASAAPTSTGRGGRDRPEPDHAAGRTLHDGGTDRGRPSRRHRTRHPVRRLRAVPRRPPEPLPRDPVLGQATTTARCASGWRGRALPLPAPEGLTAADGAMLEPLGVAIHTWTSLTSAGTSVGVFGAGPIGLFCLQVAKAAGRRAWSPPTGQPPHRLAGGARPRGGGVRGRGRAGGEGHPGGGGRPRPRRGDRGGRVQAAVDAAAEAVRPGGASCWPHPLRRAHELQGVDRAPQGLTLVMVGG